MIKYITKNELKTMNTKNITKDGLKLIKVNRFGELTPKKLEFMKKIDDSGLQIKLFAKKRQGRNLQQEKRVRDLTKSSKEGILRQSMEMEM